MKIPKRLSPRICEALDRLLGSGARLVAVRREGAGTVLVIDRPVVLAADGTAGGLLGVSYPSPQSLAGFSDPGTMDELVGPADQEPGTEELTAMLSPVLRPFLDAELARGNRIAEVHRMDTAAGQVIVVRLGDPLQLPAALPAGVARFQSWDPHHPVEEGLTCLERKDQLSGPPGAIVVARRLLEPVVNGIVAGDLATTAALSRGRLTVEGIARALRAYPDLDSMPGEAWRPTSAGTPPASLDISPKASAGGITEYSVRLGLWRRGAGRPSGLGLFAVVGIGPDQEARVGILDLTDGLDAFEPGERLDAETVSAAVFSTPRKPPASGNRRGDGP